MKKILLVLLLLPLLSQAQDLKDIFKFGTVYGAVNGGTSLSDEDQFSVTNGLQTSVIETPYDYSILFGKERLRNLDMKTKKDLRLLLYSIQRIQKLMVRQKSLQNIQP